MAQSDNATEPCVRLGVIRPLPAAAADLPRAMRAGRLRESTGRATGAASWQEAGGHRLVMVAPRGNTYSARAAHLELGPLPSHPARAPEHRPRHLLLHAELGRQRRRPPLAPGPPLLGRRGPSGDRQAKLWARAAGSAAPASRALAAVQQLAGCIDAGVVFTAPAPATAGAGRRSSLGSASRSRALW